jgi:hypothetical protein
LDEEDVDDYEPVVEEFCAQAVYPFVQEEGKPL